jgi:hypothetical protein
MATNRIWLPVRSFDDEDGYDYYFHAPTLARHEAEALANAGYESDTAINGERGHARSIYLPYAMSEILSWVDREERVGNLKVPKDIARNLDTIRRAQ